MKSWGIAVLGDPKLVRRGRSALAGMVLAATAALTAGCSSGMSDLPLIEQSTPSETVVEAGDKLRIAVQDLKDLNADYVVDETGVIALPMIKTVEVQGKTYRQIESAIEDALRGQQLLVNPRVSVQPLDLRPIYILGEVNRPGEYAYRQGMTVFSAISLAGGYTYRAKSGQVAVTRVVNGKSISGKARETTPVRPGDRIRVVERWF